MKARLPAEFSAFFFFSAETLEGRPKRRTGALQSRATSRGRHEQQQRAQATVVAAALQLALHRAARQSLPRSPSPEPRRTPPRLSLLNGGVKRDPPNTHTQSPPASTSFAKKPWREKERKRQRLSQRRIAEAAAPLLAFPPRNISLPSHCNSAKAPRCNPAKAPQICPGSESPRFESGFDPFF